jgi:hypothetical protein
MKYEAIKKNVVIGALGRASASSLSRAAAGPAQAGSRADQTAGRAGCVKQPASQPGLFGPATDNTALRFINDRGKCQTHRVQPRQLG